MVIEGIRLEDLEKIKEFVNRSGYIFSARPTNRIASNRLNEGCKPKTMGIKGKSSKLDALIPSDPRLSKVGNQWKKSKENKLKYYDIINYLKLENEKCLEIYKNYIDRVYEYNILNVNSSDLLKSTYAEFLNSLKIQKPVHHEVLIDGKEYLLYYLEKNKKENVNDIGIAFNDENDQILILKDKFAEIYRELKFNENDEICLGEKFNINNKHKDYKYVNYEVFNSCEFYLDPVNKIIKEKNEPLTADIDCLSAGGISSKIKNREYYDYIDNEKKKLKLELEKNIHNQVKLNIVRTKINNLKNLGTAHESTEQLIKDTKNVINHGPECYHFYPEEISDNDRFLTIIPDCKFNDIAKILDNDNTIEIIRNSEFGLNYFVLKGMQGIVNFANACRENDILFEINPLYPVTNRDGKLVYDKDLKVSEEVYKNFKKNNEEFNIDEFLKIRALLLQASFLKKGDFFKKYHTYFRLLYKIMKTKNEIFIKIINEDFKYLTPLYFNKIEELNKNKELSARLEQVDKLIFNSIEFKRSQRLHYLYMNDSSGVKSALFGR